MDAHRQAGDGEGESEYHGMKNSGNGIPRGGRFRGASWVGGLLVLAGMMAAGAAQAEVAPLAPPPDFTVIPGDRFVRISWPRQADSLLTATGFQNPSLPSWLGEGKPVLSGTFLGTCDQDYRLDVRRAPLPDSLVVEWSEIPLDTASLRGTFRIPAADTPVAFASGLAISVPSTQVFSLDPSETLTLSWGSGGTSDSVQAAGNWSSSNAAPYSTGLGLRQRSGLFVFTALSTNDLSAAGGGPLSLGWSYTEVVADSSLTRMGTVSVPRSDSLISVRFDSTGVMRTVTRIGFAAGHVDAGESFAMRVDPTVMGGDQVTVLARTYEGYSIWRSEVINLRQPVFLGRMRHCEGDSATLLLLGEPTIEYIDHEVHNGYPYYYAVTVADAPRDSISGDLWLDLRQKVYPVQVEYNEDYTSGGSPFRTADGAHAVPNPYKVSEEWEEGPPKIQFVNLPPGATVRVFTASGDLVVTLHQTDPLSDRISWDTKSESGRKVRSGIYLFHVESPYGEKMGRFIIIR